MINAFSFVLVCLPLILSTINNINNNLAEKDKLECVKVHSTQKVIFCIDTLGYGRQPFLLWSFSFLFSLHLGITFRKSSLVFFCSFPWHHSHSFPRLFVFTLNSCKINSTLITILVYLRRMSSPRDMYYQCIVTAPMSFPLMT